MEKFLVELLNLIAIGAILCFPFFKTKGKGILAVSVITIQVIIASVVLSESVRRHEAKASRQLWAF